MFNTSLLVGLALYLHNVITSGGKGGQYIHLQPVQKRARRLVETLQQEVPCMLRYSGHAVSALLQNVPISGTCMQQQAAVFTVRQGCHMQRLPSGFVACKLLLQGL